MKGTLLANLLLNKKWNILPFCYSIDGYLQRDLHSYPVQVWFYQGDVE